jgi:hypothetical protein
MKKNFKKHSINLLGMDLKNQNIKNSNLLCLLMSSLEPISILTFLSKNNIKIIKISITLVKNNNMNKKILIIKIDKIIKN